MTEDHSLFTIENGYIIPKPTNQFRENDIIVVPKRFAPDNIIKEINIAKEFMNNLTDKELDYIFVDRIDKKLVKKFMINKNSRDHMRYYRNLISLDLIKKRKIIMPEDIILRHADSNFVFNGKIKVTKELIKLLGYYAAEGHCRKHCIEFYLGSHEKEFIKDLEFCIKKVFNIKPIIKERKTKSSETDVIIPGKLSSLIFKDILKVGNSSYEKRVPDIIFNVGKELQKIYLESYLIGDGYKRSSKNTGFAGITVSKDLINGLQYLSTFLDVGYSTRTDNNKIRDFGEYISKCAPAHHIYLQKENIIKQSTALTNQIPIIETGLYDIATNNYDLLNSFNNNHKLGFKMLNQKAITFNTLKRDTSHLINYNNLNLKNIIKIANGDLAFLRIKKIEKVPYKQDWVYDLCVKGYEKFVGGNGAIFLHNSGTADTMEVLAPVSHSIEKIKEIVKKTNACMVWGGALELATADDKLIKLERPLSLDPEGVLLASILAKKLAVGATHVLIDIPLGKHAKIHDAKQAKRLKRNFNHLGKLLGMETKVIITDGSQPIGNGIGPALEARDVLSILLNKGPEDLKAKALLMSGILLKMVGVRNSYQVAKEILESGKAYKKMQEIIKAQGGNPNIKPENIKLGKYNYNYRAKSNGYVSEIKNKLLTKIAKIAGAPKSKGSGIYIYVKLKDKIKNGQILFTIYAENKKDLDYTMDIYKLEPIIIKQKL